LIRKGFGPFSLVPGQLPQTLGLRSASQGPICSNT